MKPNKKSMNQRKQSKNLCPSCGTLMQEASGKLKFPVNGEEITVQGLTFLKCKQCEEKILRLDESRKLREQAIELYRTRNGLLLADEIRALRERYGFTQCEFATLLKLGVNTLSRWESGRNVQTAAMDILLRLIRDVPGTLDYLGQLVA